jgi:hypothetical protein
MTTTTPTRPRRPTRRPAERPARPARPVRSGDGAGSAGPSGSPEPVRRRSAARPADRPTRRPARRPARPAAPPRTPFVLLLVGLLGGALVSLLVLNTVLAQDAFTLTELQRSNQQLNQQRQALQEEIAKEESPTRLAPRAKALGMREPHQPAFVDARTGHVVGPRARPVPYPAAAGAAAAGVIGLPGAIVPGAGGPGGTR